MFIILSQKNVSAYNYFVMIFIFHQMLQHNVTFEMLQHIAN